MYNDLVISCLEYDNKTSEIDEKMVIMAYVFFKYNTVTIYDLNEPLKELINKYIEKDQKHINENENEQKHVNVNKNEHKHKHNHENENTYIILEKLSAIHSASNLRLNPISDVNSD